MSQEDLAAVRKVLCGKVTLAKAARQYTARQSVLVAVIILLAAGRVAFSRKGEYGALLYHLAAQPGVPPGGWQKKRRGFVVRPKWYETKGYYMVKTAGRMGMHTSQDRAGNNLSLTPQPQLWQLVQEDPAYTERARTWYEQAMERVEEDRQREAQWRAKRSAEKRRERQMHAAIRRHPHLLHQMKYVHFQSPERLRQLCRELNKIVDRYFPE